MAKGCQIIFGQQPVIEPGGELIAVQCRIQVQGYCGNLPVRPPPVVNFAIQTDDALVRAVIDKHADYPERMLAPVRR